MFHTILKEDYKNAPLGKVESLGIIFFPGNSILGNWLLMYNKLSHMLWIQLVSVSCLLFLPLMYFFLLWWRATGWRSFWSSVYLITKVWYQCYFLHQCRSCDCGWSSSRGIYGFSYIRELSFSCYVSLFLQFCLFSFPRATIAKSCSRLIW